MPGWQDDPIVDEGPQAALQTAPAPVAMASWQGDPIVEAAPRAQEVGTQYDSSGIPDSVPDMPGQGRPQSPEPSSFQGVKDYARGVVDAAGRVIAAPINPLGTMEAAGSVALGAVGPPIASVAGIGTEAARGLGLTDARGEDVAQRVQNAISYQPRSESGQAMTGLAGAVTAPITESGADIALAPLFAGEAQALAARPARIPADARRAPTGRAPVLNEPVSLGGPAAARRAVPAAANEGRAAGLAKVSGEAPTVEQLRDAKNSAYKRSEKAGVKLSENSIARLKAKIVKELGERVDPTLHPDTTAALKRIVDTEGDISLEKLDTLRQIASDAKGSVKAGDGRLAAKIVDTIDEYTDTIGAKDIVAGDAKGAAILTEARALNTRLKKGEEIADLFRNADIKAKASPNYGQSSVETALRAEFKALALDKKRFRRFNAQEQAAIERAATGGNLERSLRFFGRFAPSGPMSAMIATILSGSVGGPAGIAAVGGAVGARYSAARMSLRNASAVDELVRRGPPSARKMLEQRMLKKQPEVSD